MKKLWNKINLSLLVIVVTSLFIFLPGLSTYFSQDDFIHLSFSLSGEKVLKAFNIFSKGEFPFYRPIPTQVYYFVNYTLFGLWTAGYHMINFILFAINCLLVFTIINKLVKKTGPALIAVLFFSINSTHFASLFSPAYVHELFYVLFGLSTIYFYIKFFDKQKKWNLFISILFYILALMSKETAVMVPFILSLVNFFSFELHAFKSRLKSIIPYLVVLLVYLVGHFFYYGIAQSPSYQLIIGKPTLNILFWYFLWALSTPNILIDFVGPGLNFNTTFLAVSSIQGWIYLVLFPVFIILGFVLATSRLRNRGKKKKDQRFIFLGVLWFVVGLIPLIIFPLHKLATEQAFSLVGLTLIIGDLVYRNYIAGKSEKFISVVFVSVYLIIAFNSILLATKTHWIVKSAKQAHAVITYFQDKYKDFPANQVIYFKNGEVKIPQYGSAKQLYYALGNGVALSLVYKRNDLLVYFDDIKPLPEEKLKSSDVITINSSQFLGY